MNETGISEDMMAKIRALTAPLVADQEKKVEESQKPKVEIKTETSTASQGGETTVDGKSLGRVTASREEREGEEFLGRNPEDVVIGEKRKDFKPVV